MRLPFRPFERIRDRINDRRDRRAEERSEVMRETKSKLQEQQEAMRKEELSAEKIGHGQYLFSAAHPLLLHYEQSDGKRLDDWVRMNPADRSFDMPGVLNADLRSGRNSQRVEDRLFYVHIDPTFSGVVTLWQYGKQKTLKCPEGELLEPTESAARMGEVEQMKRELADTRASLDRILPLLQAVRDAMGGSADVTPAARAKADELQGQADALKQRVLEQEDRLLKASEEK